MEGPEEVSAIFLFYFVFLFLLFVFLSSWLLLRAAHLTNRVLLLIFVITAVLAAQNCA